MNSDTRPAVLPGVVKDVEGSSPRAARPMPRCSTKKTIQATLKGTRRGSIVLLHDIHSTTVAALPGVIGGLHAKGYAFVTVSQLLGKPKPGRVYSRA